MQTRRLGSHGPEISVKGFEAREAGLGPERGRSGTSGQGRPASIANRVLPVPPGPPRVTSRAPSANNDVISATSCSRPTKELAG
jgi:hypothetical protein